MDKIILDSDILIFVSRNHPAAIGFVEISEEVCGVAISSVSVFELIIGCQN